MRCLESARRLRYGRTLWPLLQLVEWMGTTAMTTFTLSLSTNEMKTRAPPSATGLLHLSVTQDIPMEALLDHFHALFASKPMNECEVIAGRTYTGPLYFMMNGSLRKASKKLGEQEHLKGNSYTKPFYVCNSLLRKFSEISIIPPGRKVCRGMSGMVDVTLKDTWCKTALDVATNDEARKWRLWQCGESLGEKSY